MAKAKELAAPFELVKWVAENGKLPVPNFSAGGIATPADASLVMQTISLIYQGHSAAWAWHHLINERVSQMQKLEDQLETRKKVERAKGVLMEKHKLSEQEAFRRIQKLSMNTRKSMREVAEAILLADELNVK